MLRCLLLAVLVWLVAAASPPDHQRALLQQQAAGPRLPVCELMVAYRVVDLAAGNFTSVVTLSNNRELDLSHWQVVWRFQDYRRVGLSRADGAIQLSPGSTSGAPVRLVDTFENDGIPGGGGTYSFLAAGALLGPPPPLAGDPSLGIEAVNINGLQCGLVGQASMAYSACLAADTDGEALSALPAGGAPADAPADGGGGSSSGACWEHFCCGMVLADPSVAPPPPPPPAPAPEEPAPQPAIQPPLSPILGPQLPSPPALGDGAAPGNSSTGSGGQREQRGGGLLSAALGCGGAALALLLAVGLRLWRRRRRRSSLAADVTDTGSKMAAEAASGSPESSVATRPWQVPCGSLTLGSILAPAQLVPQDSAAAGTPGAGSQLTIAQSIPAAASPTPGKASGGGGDGSALSGASSGAGGIDLARDVALHEQLGSGAFGTVYRGSWRGQAVAVKVMQTACGARSRELDSFRQEALVLAGLRHPHIVAMLAACTVPPNICIIEELAEGGSLHHRLHGGPGPRRRRPLPYGELLAVAADVADALCYLHPRIVHRDLKSQAGIDNVLLDAAGRAKVCDFGIAKFKDRTFVSTAGAQAGTPAYMAPEMFDGAPVSEKVDVFSFAVLCWEMLTGEVPWRELQGPMQVVFTVAVQRQRLALPEACPAFLRGLIEECWDEEPTRRPGFPAIRQRLQGELARAAADAGLAQRRLACRSTASETDACSAPAWTLQGRCGSLGSQGRAEGCEGRGSGPRLGSPEPAQPMVSPFAASAAPFSSSSEGSSDGSGSSSGSDA